jgi:hypothetical protein
MVKANCDGEVTSDSYPIPILEGEQIGNVRVCCPQSVSAYKDAFYKQGSDNGQPLTKRPTQKIRVWEKHHKTTAATHKPKTLAGNNRRHILG